MIDQCFSYKVKGKALRDLAIDRIKSDMGGGGGLNSSQTKLQLQLTHGEE